MLVKVHRKMYLIIVVEKFSGDCDETVNDEKNY